VRLTTLEIRPDLERNKIAGKPAHRQPRRRRQAHYPDLVPVVGATAPSSSIRPGTTVLRRLPV